MFVFGLLAAAAATTASSGPSAATVTAPVPSSHATACTQQLFVSPAGDDGANGGLGRPFRTLGRAQLAARAAQSAARGGVCVNLRAGVYSRADGGVPLALTVEDSGTAAAPIVWRAYRSEDVLISAGLHVSPPFHPSL